MPDLDHLRADLDALDRRLVDALAERQRLVDDVATLKADDGALPLRDPGRERALLARIAALAEDAGVDGYFAQTLYRQILRHSVRFQAARQSGAGAPRVVYQGEPGCYSHAAARHHFGAVPGVAFDGARTFEAAVDALRRGEADRAFLPVENTTAGPIPGVYDLLVEPGLHLVGEEVLRVEHCLLACADVPLSRVRRVGSHAQALAQCSEFLASLDGVRIDAEDDTAGAAKGVAEAGDETRAAIAGEDAAERYGLHVIKRNVANRKDNLTRFVVVAREPLEHDERLPHKTSLVLTTGHEHGALAAVLQALADGGLNLTKLESRPSRVNPWEYAFYADVEGGLHEARVRDAVEAAEAQAASLRVLGSYPAFQPETARAALAPAAGAPASRPKATAASGKPSRLALAARADRPDTVVEIGGVRIGGDEPPVLIAGPCSVEGRDQILEAARGVRAAGGQMLRGGCFKPRTIPYDFQGLGFPGLTLLHEAGRRHGLPVVTEVLHPADVEAVAREADVLQIGARNMQNFELLKAVGQTRTAVLLKRGMMASVDEWLAAAEYVLAGGNERVILCERGIRTFETATRNTLDLSAVVVARERTHLPVIVDPSHAAGVRRWVPALAKAALAAGAHGLIVEAHPDPESALSDGPQSLTLDALADLAADLGLRQPVAA
jgi:chorismate mutase/prephenate dehydratase